MDIDWAQLHQAAKDVMVKAYAPYSNFKVGVAGLVSDGRVVVGCNSLSKTSLMVVSIENIPLH